MAAACDKIIEAAKATEGDDLWSRESLEQEMNYLLEIAPQLVDYHLDSVQARGRYTAARSRSFDLRSRANSG